MPTTAAHSAVSGCRTRLRSLLLGVLIFVAALTPARSSAFSGPFLIMVEHGVEASAVLEVPVSDPTVTRRLATVEHAAGGGPLVSVSPDGRRLALVQVLDNRRSRLVAIDLETGAVRTAGDGFDPTSAPVWRPDSGAVVLRTATDEVERLVWVSLDGTSGQIVQRDRAVIPLGYDSSLHFWHLEPGPGTPVLRSQGREIALPAQFARDAALSPDREAAVLTLVDNGASTVVIVDLASGSITTVARAAGYQRAVWIESGRLLMGVGQPGVPVLALTPDAGGQETEVVAGPGIVLPVASTGGDAAVVERAFGPRLGAIDRTQLEVARNGTVSRLPGSWFAGVRSTASPLASPTVVDARIASVQGTDQTCAQTGVSGVYQPRFNEVNEVFDQVASRQLQGDFPSLGNIERGVPFTLQPATVPNVILKAIGWVESGWRQAASGTARGSSGAPLVGGIPTDANCGYGIMQITSGMQSPGALDTNVQQRVAAEYRYNIAYGARMLVDRWNWGDNNPFRYVGDRNPCLIEHWYYAVLAYNGLLPRNNPANYNPSRPIYNGTQSVFNYPYQDLVWGWLRNPPSAEGARLWAPVQVTYPADSWFSNGWQNLPSSAVEPTNVGSNCSTFTVATGSVSAAIRPGTSRTGQIIVSSLPPNTTINLSTSGPAADLVQLGSSSTSSAGSIPITFSAPSGQATGTFTGQVLIDAGSQGTRTVGITVVVANMVFDRYAPATFRGRTPGW